MADPNELVIEVPTGCLVAAVLLVAAGLGVAAWAFFVLLRTFSPWS